MLVVATSSVQVEAQLAAGRFACPACGGSLARWGWAPVRTVRDVDGLGQVRLRRTRCRGCGRTHVLVPASLAARRRDSVEVIGQALALAAGGAGHRRIAAELDRPPQTVRGWLRAARRGAQALRASGLRWLVALDCEPAPVAATGSALGDAVEALLLAVSAWVRRFGPDRGSGPWERAQSLTRGLLSPRPALPP